MCFLITFITFSDGIFGFCSLPGRLSVWCWRIHQFCMCWALGCLPVQRARCGDDLSGVSQTAHQFFASFTHEILDLLINKLVNCGISYTHFTWQFFSVTLMGFFAITLCIYQCICIYQKLHKVRYSCKSSGKRILIPSILFAAWNLLATIRISQWSVDRFPSIALFL